MKPPFTLTSKILGQVGRIERIIGQLESFEQPTPQPQLRKSTRVKTLRGSLAIEGNSLSEEQITAVLEGKPVIAPKNEIQEILNANTVYEKLSSLSGQSKNDLLNSHKLMMNQLISDAGKWRSGNVGIIKQGRVAHLAPPAERVPYLMTDLFDFLMSEEHPLIKSSVFHYEFEFIHPFSDGNGRLGRFWHSLLLYEFHPVFEYIPVESIIKKHQQEYYDVLEHCDHSGDSTDFIVFCLQMIEEALEDFVRLFRPPKASSKERLQCAQVKLENAWFTRKVYMEQHKKISSATASRDLKYGVDKGLLIKKGNQATSQYQFPSS